MKKQEIIDFTSKIKSALELETVLQCLADQMFDLSTICKDSYDEQRNILESVRVIIP